MEIVHLAILKYPESNSIVLFRYYPCIIPALSLLSGTLLPIPSQCLRGYSGPIVLPSMRTNKLTKIQIAAGYRP